LPTSICDKNRLSFSIQLDLLLCQPMFPIVESFDSIAYSDILPLIAILFYTLE